MSERWALSRSSTPGLRLYRVIPCTAMAAAVAATMTAALAAAVAAAVAAVARAIGRNQGHVRN